MLILLTRVPLSASSSAHAYAFNAAITACGKSGQQEEAMAVFKSMDAAGVRQDAIRRGLAGCTLWLEVSKG